MNPADASPLDGPAGGAPESPFDAGQQIAREVLQSSAQRFGGVDAVAVMAGLFSGAMTALQAMVGDDELANLFARFLATAEPTDKVRH